MASRAVKLLVMQAHRMLGLALQRWHDADGATEPEITGVVDEDLAQRESDREELRRRGVNV
ncbi:MAG: hypothetical protein ABI488_05775 [Polyangiaceae bacterium]